MSVFDILRSGEDIACIVQIKTRPTKHRNTGRVEHGFETGFLDGKGELKNNWLFVLELSNEPQVYKSDKPTDTLHKVPRLLGQDLNLLYKNARYFDGESARQHFGSDMVFFDRDDFIDFG